MYVCMYACMHAYIHAYIHTYIHFAGLLVGRSAASAHGIEEVVDLGDRGYYYL